MDLNFTKEELDAVKQYKTEKYEALNQLLVSNTESDIALLSDEIENKVVAIEYDRDSIIDDALLFKTLYRVFFKCFYTTENKPRVLYRGTNLAEIDRIKAEPYIDRILSSTKNQNDAENKYAKNWNQPAEFIIKLEEDVPVMDFDLLKIFDGVDKGEVLISPFTKVKSFEFKEEKLLDNSKKVKVFEITLEKQNLDRLVDSERNGLFNFILENCYSIRRKIQDCIKIEKENVINYENIRRLEQLLNKYETAIDEKESGKAYSDLDRYADYEDVTRVNKELENLKQMSNNVFAIRKENINFVNNWKRNVAVYLIAECKEIELAFAGTAFDLRYFENPVDKFEEINEKVSEEQIMDNNIKENVEQEDLEVSQKVEEVIDKIVDEDEKLDKAEDLNDIVKDADKEETEEAEDDLVVNVDEIKVTVNGVEIDDEGNEDSDDIVANESIENKEEGIKVDSEKKDDIDDTKSLDIVNQTEEIEKEEDNIEVTEGDNDLHKKVKNEANDNINLCKKLIDNINVLIKKQQNHARIAQVMGCNYSALNKAFDMRNKAEELLGLLRIISLKIKNICSKEYSDEDELNLENISVINNEITVLFNYLNNAKIVSSTSHVTRFEEMAIIEENELKRGIATRIRDVRGEAELKKLKDDFEIIQDKTAFEKFIGFFTGKNKLDEFMIEQIEIRQQAIRRTLSRTLSLAYNYSIHELIAEIKMFVDENEDDELILTDVDILKNINEELKKNYVIIDSKVQNIIDDREGKNLPLEKNLSKEEALEIDTYRFLKKYKYDLPENKNEPKYQDTMANEIGRIIEYVNTSNVVQY